MTSNDLYFLDVDSIVILYISCVMCKNCACLNIMVQEFPKLKIEVSDILFTVNLMSKT